METPKYLTVGKLGIHCAESPSLVRMALKNHDVDFEFYIEIPGGTLVKIEDYDTIIGPDGKEQKMYRIKVLDLDEAGKGKYSTCYGFTRAKEGKHYYTSDYGFNHGTT